MPEVPEKNRPLRELLFKIWRSIRVRPLQKLAAVLIAIVFWMIVVAGDPSIIIERTIQNAPVSIDGEAALRSRGLIVTDDLSGTITVKMRISVKRSDYERATVEYFTPRIDLDSQITQVGQNQQAAITVPVNSIGEVLSLEPESIPINVENYTWDRVPVVVEYAGETSSPLWFSTPALDPSYITVNGPESLVSQIERAVVTLPLNSLSENRPSDSLSAELELQDASNNPVSSPLLRVVNGDVTINSARINLTVYPMKEIPVSVEEITSGVPAHGYEVKNIQISPNAVSAAATRDTLDKIDALYLQNPISIADIKESTTISVPLMRISGVQHMAVDEVTVTIVIGPAKHVHTHTDMPVSVYGVDSSLEMRLSHDVMDVIIWGDYDKVQSLKAENITLYVDATGLGEGVHMLDVMCLVNGIDAYEFTTEIPRVTLTLTSSGNG